MISSPKPVKLEKKKKRRPKSERQILVKELDNIVSLIVRKRDGQCVTPGPSCGGFLTASHWQNRGKMATRFDTRNVNAQCRNCNGRHNRYTSYYDAYMLKKYGGDVCLELAEKSLAYLEVDYLELRELLEKLTKTYEEL